VKVLCFSKLGDPRLFELLEFYREDILAFERLGFSVDTENRIWSAAVAEGDLLYAWWGATALPVLLAWRLRGRKCVLTGAVAFGDRDLGPAVRRWTRRALVLIASRVANETLAVSKHEADELRRSGFRRARLAYHSVDVEFYVPGSKAASPRAVTVGQMNRASITRKGIDLCVAAMPIIRRQVPNFELDIVGPITSDGQGWIDAVSAADGLEGIHIHGKLSREGKRALLQEAWVYLQPSRHEAFGVAAVEAMACGTVPVHSPDGALAEVVGDAGIGLAARTADCLAEEVIRLVNDDDRRRVFEARSVERSAAFGRPQREKVLAAVVTDVLEGRWPPKDGNPRTAFHP
jgi:glycosyltransferase involved in cell wall biosynthesis